MSKRKVPAEERRRATPEINLLAEASDRGVLDKARKGCSIPFLGGGLMITMLAAAALHAF